MLLGRLEKDSGAVNGSMREGYFSAKDNGLPVKFDVNSKSLAFNDNKQRLMDELEGRLRLEHEGYMRQAEKNASQARKKAAEAESSLKGALEQMQLQIEQQVKQQLEVERSKQPAQGSDTSVQIDQQLSGRTESSRHRYPYSVAKEDGTHHKGEHAPLSATTDVSNLLPVRLLEFEPPSEKLLQQFETPILEHEIELHETGHWSEAALSLLLERLRSKFDTEIQLQISSFGNIQRLAEVAVLGLSYLAQRYTPVVQMIQAQEKRGLESLLELVPTIQVQSSIRSIYS
jgi:hypothetical protein